MSVCQESRRKRTQGGGDTRSGKMAAAAPPPLFAGPLSPLSINFYSRTNNNLFLQLAFFSGQKCRINKYRKGVLIYLRFKQVEAFTFAKRRFA